MPVDSSGAALSAGGGGGRGAAADDAVVGEAGVAVSAAVDGLAPAFSTVLAGVGVAVDGPSSRFWGVPATDGVAAFSRSRSARVNGPTVLPVFCSRCAVRIGP